jgi:hypothetical protein
MITSEKIVLEFLKKEKNCFFPPFFLSIICVLCFRTKCETFNTQMWIFCLCDLEYNK